METEYENLIKKIDSYDIVSFDVFDTLLLRNVVKPSDIFELLSEKVAKIYKIDNFYNMRIEAEAQSRKLENGLETNLDLIYNQLSLSSSQKEEIKNIEIDLELSFLTYNPFMKKIFEYCRANNKEVICITDMYLPKQVIKEGLKKNGYNDVEIYLSCDYMKQKRDGSLYLEVYNQKKYDKNKWLHIGDNYESDYVQAINFGISAYHYKKVLERNSFFIPNSMKSIITAVCMNQVENGLEYDSKFKEKLYREILNLYSFVSWLCLYTKDYDNIYFVKDAGMELVEALYKNVVNKNEEKKSILRYTSNNVLLDSSCIVLMSLDKNFIRCINKKKKNIKFLSFVNIHNLSSNVKSFNKNYNDIFSLSLEDSSVNNILEFLSKYSEYIDNTAKTTADDKSNNRLFIENLIFIVIFVIIILCGTVYSKLSVNDINKFENRVAHQFPDFSLFSFYEKNFQDEYELALSDQLPFSDDLKLMIKTGIINIQKGIYRFKNDGTYNKLNDTINLYNDVLVYSPDVLDNLKVSLDKRINNINKIVESNSDLKYYLFYIEKDTDINFESNSKVGVYEYMTDKLSLKIKHSKFSVDNFNQFKNYFYKTDHHWNYKGSYKGYKDVASLMSLNNVIPIKEERCLKTTFSGSKATAIGGTAIYKEPFCAYTFDIPSHFTYINGKKVDSYGDYKNILENEPDETLYGDFYGWDDGLIEFDYNDNDKENLLIIGESYDNAINELLSTHFNKTFNVDLRWYSTYNEHEFDFASFVEENEIDTVLFIGNGGFYLQDDFKIGEN